MQPENIPKAAISVEGTDAEISDQLSNSADSEQNQADFVSPTGTAPPASDTLEESREEIDHSPIIPEIDEVNTAVKFQLIPISEVAGRNAVGEVVERILKDGEVMKLGRLIVRDGQTTIKGKKPATEIDSWFTSKVVSRLHAEIWSKDGQVN